MSDSTTAGSQSAETIHRLEQHILRLEGEIATLRSAGSAAPPAAPVAASARSHPTPLDRHFGVAGLSRDQVERYSRQMILEELGPLGTKKLVESHALIIGAGGLGSAVAPYLAAAGVGRLTIVDFDVVERSNLHRQVMHNDLRVGMPKAISAKLTCEALNPNCQVNIVLERFDVNNAQELCRNCDVVIDASDNVAARYMINDAAVLENKPLVSGSAMRFEGQLSVYHNTPLAPCYRCVFPKPPVVEAGCNDTGVCGVVPGIIGALQAVEAIKVLANIGDVISGRMLLFQALHGTFKVVKIRGRQKSCAVCSLDEEHRRIRSVTEAFRSGGHPEYGAQGGCQIPKYQLLIEEQRIPMKFFADQYTSRPAGGIVGVNGDVDVLDVRPAIQYDMVSLPNTVNVPLRVLKGMSPHDAVRLVMDALDASRKKRTAAAEKGPEQDKPHIGGRGPSELQQRRVFVICRRGVASVDAAALLNLGSQHHDATSDAARGGEVVRFVNVDGGLNRYSREVDAEFPWY